MPIYNRLELDERASEYGFQRDAFEKVLRLKRILEFFQSDEILTNHLILKGGTAINLTVFALPRLSVDIDMDYIPNDSKEEMKANRVKIDKTIRDYMDEEGYHLANDSRFHHSLDSYRFQYQNAGGNKDMIKIELNYSHRAHVFEAENRRILTDAFGETTNIRTVCPIEIFAGKTNALLSRAAARDIYDINNMIDSNLFSDEKDLFRKMVIFYVSISSNIIHRGFDTSEIDGISFFKIRRDLFPVLTKNEARMHFDLEKYKTNVKKYIQELMILTPQESEYIERFIYGEYKPELLFDDEYVVSRIVDHPMALWKIEMNKESQSGS